MVSWIWLVVAVILAVAITAGVMLFIQRQRSFRLRRRFGPEYDRAVSERGDRREAEVELERRQRRVQSFDIRPLSREDRERYAGQWRAVQARFVDDPDAAIAEADRLVREVMRARGYPVGDFEERAADLSVEHPNVVEHYRAANRIARRHEGGESNTEDLRNAIVHYRALFEELLGDRVRVAGRSREVEER